MAGIVNERIDYFFLPPPLGRMAAQTFRTRLVDNGLKMTGQKMNETHLPRMPPLPQIGLPESFYALHGLNCERIGDIHGREAFKVGQYLTLACQPSLSWDEKLRYYRHALQRHCVPPPVPAEDVWIFYRDLANLVRKYAGEEALRLAMVEDGRYVQLVEEGLERVQIARQAPDFFRRFITDENQLPLWFMHEDYEQLKVVRNNWTRYFDEDD
jgi:hypothetical protein